MELLYRIGVVRSVRVDKLSGCVVDSCDGYRGLVSHRNHKLSIVNYPLLIAFCLLLSVNAFAQYGGGSGTSSDPYIISTAAHLSTLATNVNGGNTYSGKFFKLTADITATAVTTVIGEYSHPFKGNFNGNGKTIKLSISVGQYEWGALFGYIAGGANIHDVVVSGSVSGGYIAGIVAGIDNNGDIIVHNCTNNATITATDNYCGGIVAYIGSGSSIIEVSDCVNNGEINSTSYQVGGIVGCISGTSTAKIINRCSNLKSVTGSYNVGGIVGFSWGSQIRNCYNKGEVHSTYVGSDSGGYYSCGGIVGTSQQGCTIENCYNIGNVKGYNNSYKHAVGGIVGYNHYAGIIRNSYNGGTISQSDSGYLGGIVGYNYNDSDNHIDYCYSVTTACSNLKGSSGSSTGISTTTVAKFTHNSPTSNTLSSPCSGQLLSALNAWVTANGNNYLTWENATSESDNKGMPKFYTCTPISVTNFSVSNGNRECGVSWTATGATSCKLYYGSDLDINNMWLVNNATSPFTARRLTNGRTYYFVVKPTGDGTTYCADNEPSDAVEGNPNCP